MYINLSYLQDIPLRYPKDQIHVPRDLGEIPEFQELPPKPLEELAALMKLRLYVPQQVILQQGPGMLVVGFQLVFITTTVCFYHENSLCMFVFFDIW